MRPDRETIRAERLARKARTADALAPALIEAARLVYTALTDQCFWCSIGFNGSRHIVTVRSVTADIKPRVESIANKALKNSPRFPDVVAFQSYMTITIREGRKEWELARWAERGDGGTILLPNRQGVLVPVGNPEPCKPVAALGYE